MLAAPGVRRVESVVPPGTSTYDAFAVTAPGLAPLVAAELRELGVEPAAVDDAGVAFAADVATLYRANIQLRIASRVVIRAASFRAAHFSDLDRQARQVPWDRWVPRGAAVTVRVTSHKSRLYHTDAIAERLQAAIAARAGTVAMADVPDDDGHDASLVVARLERDRCSVSVDSSGALLHRRGYRQELARAPLRETIAAAMLRASGWTSDQPLVDPFCGSGTIPIEAALVARRIAPGRGRTFALERWPEADHDAIRRVREDVMAEARASGLASIQGADRDAGAIAAATSNAERAGVGNDVRFARQAISELEPPETGVGFLVTNPPYGERIGDAGALRALYARLGQVVRHRLGGWGVAILASDASLVRCTGLPVRRVLATSNGGIRVGLWVCPAAGAPRR